MMIYLMEWYGTNEILSVLFERIEKKNFVNFLSSYIFRNIFSGF